MGPRICFANGKGGVAKSTCTAALAGVWADRGRRALVVDLDPQSNQAEVCFGLNEHDEGRSLYDAVLAGDASLVRTVPVRDGIDLIAAGEWTAELGEDIVVAGNALARSAGQRRITDAHRADACGEVESVIAELAPGYDVVLIDTPPAYGNALAIAGLLSSDYLVIPTRAGKMSRSGLLKLVRMYQRHHVPAELLGVVLVGVPAAATTLVRTEMSQLAGLFGGDDLPLLGTVRAAEKAAFDQEEAGLLAVEYLDAATQIGRRGGARFASNAEGLLNDYRAVAAAIDALIEPSRVLEVTA